MAVPDTRYARRADGVNIGYQSLGSGPLALVWCWGWMSHMTGADRLTVRLSRRAPGAIRALGQLAQRRVRPARSRGA